MVRWPRFQTSRHLRCVFHGLRAPSVLGGHLPHPGVQERGPCPGPGLQRGPSRGDAVSLRPATPRLWRFRPWPHAECRFHRDRRRLGPEKNSVWHVSAADSHVGKTFLKMFISANVHSQIRSIFAGARSTMFQSRWACVTARGTHVTAGGPVSQPGDVGWAGCCTPCLDVRLRPAGMGAWSPPHPPCEVPTNGHSVCVRVPCRPRRCGGREDTAVAPRVLPVGREAGQEVALATVRGPGRRGAGRPGRGFTSGHTGDQAGPWRLLQKTAGVTKSTRRGRAGATSSGNGPNVRAVTCAGASLTRRKAHRSP